MNWNIIYLIYPFICRVKTWQIVIRDCMPLFEPENIFHTRCWRLENFVPFILYSLRLPLGLSQPLFWDTKGYSVLAFFLKMHQTTQRHVKMAVDTNAEYTIARNVRDNQKHKTLLSPSRHWFSGSLPALPGKISLDPLPPFSKDSFFRWYFFQSNLKKKSF